MQAKKSATEAILDWFERNPTAKARSCPLAKALKMDATKCAEALARLAQPGGQLMRVKVEVGAKDRLPGAAKEQWEYWLALGGKAPEPVKPYKAPSVYRREPTLRAQALVEQDVKNSPVFAKTESLVQQGVPVGADEIDDTSKKVANFSETDLPPIGHPLRTLGEQLTALLDEDQFGNCESLLISGYALCEQNKCQAEQLADEWQKKYEAALVDRDNERVEAAGKIADAEIRNQQLEEALQTKGGVSAIQEERTPAGYVVVRPKKPLRRFSKLHSAQTSALGAVRAGDRADVFALYPAGKAVPSAEWRTC